MLFSLPEKGLACPHTDALRQKYQNILLLPNQHCSLQTSMFQAYSDLQSSHRWNIYSKDGAERTQLRRSYAADLTILCWRFQQNCDPSPLPAGTIWIVFQEQLHLKLK